MAVVNNAAKDVGLQTSFQVMDFISFGYIPTSGLLGHKVVLCLFFIVGGTSVLFPVVAVTFSDKF